ncbi:MAG: sigma-54-dependent Fis family transcriptional regulator [Desulfosarcina sp.]|nr:sigma-54-dependent Fis family transcriptional regulator [Desulfobacterales bacterium]
MKLKILVIDDEDSILKTFRMRLSKWGYKVFLASDGASGLKLLTKNDCHVVITDLKMPGLTGQEIVETIRKDYPNIMIIVITGFATVESAVEMMKAGVYDFLVKPLNFNQVQMVLDKIVERLDLKRENFKLKKCVSDLQSEMEERYRIGNLIGNSEAIRSVFQMIRKVASLDSTIMIYGDTGTGKEVVAKAIHYHSLRKKGAMVTVDCGTLTETLLESELFGHEKGAFTGAQDTKKGRFEQADGGTIFLDEVENASHSVQKRLLRVIDEKTFHRVGGKSSIRVDVRIVAAANQNLLVLVKEGKFRRDLYYRLNVVPIHMPLLKDRKGDVSLLAKFFMERLSKSMDVKPFEISSQAMTQLMDYSWPGNVRELLNVIERTAIMTSGNIINEFYINEEDKFLDNDNGFPLDMELPLKEQIEAFEMEYLVLVLQKYHGRLKKVVEHSGFNPRTLYRKMKQYGLDKKDF